MKVKLLIIISIILLFNLTAAAENSLWSDQASKIYQDRPDYQIGEIITVIIEEDADAVQSANTSTSQSSEVDAGAGVGFFDFIKSFGFNYSDSGSADGETTRSGTLRADISTQIADIMPDGNFRITGIKKIKINGEEQLIKLSGIIRPEDISLNNTISSKFVAEASIEYEGQGVVAEKQKPGLFERIFNWIF